MMKRIDYHRFGRFQKPMLLACSMLTMVSCVFYEYPSDVEGISLAFDVSVARSVTRMLDEKTQQSRTYYRGIQDLRLYSFNVTGIIGPNETSFTGNTFNPSLINGTLHYLDNKVIGLKTRTASFLCYARAQVSNEDKFMNGSIVANNLEGAPNTSDISFAPDVIHNSVAVAEEDKASKIAAYLTAIAKAISNDKHDFFLQFINNGLPVACSSTNVEKLKAWAETNGITPPNQTEDLSGYPSYINLPDGAAVVKWSYTEEKFVPQTQTTTEANINSWNRFVYPAELWYYANSRIKTSTSEQKDNYNLEDWSDVLAKHETDNGVINSETKSVAIKEPLTYAVGCLRIGLVVGNTLKDAGEPQKTITLSDNTFPLRAIFVSGQHEQAYNFAAKDDNNELIIYDNQIPAGISMGDAVSEYPTTGTPDKYVNTLVFQTKDGENVRFALEFENNSGENFMGCNGIVFKGTKFYLVGTIEVPVGQTDDWKKRAFTKSYTTQGTVRISSLKQAYTYLPDLLDPRLEIGIKLVPNWIQSTTTNVPL